MDDKRQKVISGFEHCIDGSNGCQRNCPYVSINACRHMLYFDAIDVLKAMEPRLMMAEEAAALPEGAVCWFEERYEKSNLSYIQPMMSNGTGMLIGTHLTASPARMSTRGRRFWSAKPTKEQREAEKWAG